MTSGRPRPQAAPCRRGRKGVTTQRSRACLVPASWHQPQFNSLMSGAVMLPAQPLMLPARQHLPRLMAAKKTCDLKVTSPAVPRCLSLGRAGSIAKVTYHDAAGHRQPSCRTAGAALAAAGADVRGPGEQRAAALPEQHRRVEGPHLQGAVGTERAGCYGCLQRGVEAAGWQQLSARQQAAVASGARAAGNAAHSGGHGVHARGTKPATGCFRNGLDNAAAGRPYSLCCHQGSSVRPDTRRLRHPGATPPLLLLLLLTSPAAAQP